MKEEFHFEKKRKKTLQNYFYETKNRNLIQKKVLKKRIRSVSSYYAMLLEYVKANASVEVYDCVVITCFCYHDNKKN